MRWGVALSLLGVLAACGADGEPEQPLPTDGSAPVTVTGTVQTGMTVSRSGVQGFGTLSLHRGPVTLSLGF